MNPSLSNPAADFESSASTLAGMTAASEILLTPDGRILAHHLTPELAAVLHHLAGPAQDLDAGGRPPGNSDPLTP